MRRIILALALLCGCGEGVTTAAPRTVASQQTTQATAFDAIETRSLTLVNDQGPVVTMGLGGNNDGRGTHIGQRQGRLQLRWHGDYSAEIEIEPGPDAHPIGNIVSQIVMWGPRTADGTGRGRLTSSLVTDGAGGLAAVIDATTNDPSGSLGQKRAPPLVINAGEGKGIYLVLYPSDNTLSVQDRVSGRSVRVPVDELIGVLSR